MWPHSLRWKNPVDSETQRIREILNQRTSVALSILLIAMSSLLVWGSYGCSSDTSDTVVAEVNGQRITSQHIQEQTMSIPEDMRVIYQQSPEKILNKLIAATLLLQEAKRKGFVESADLHGLGNPQVQEGIHRLLEMEVQSVSNVSDEEVAAFYHQHRNKMGGKSLTDIKEQIRGTLLAQKQQQRISDFVAELRSRAAIIIHPERLPKPPPPALEASTAQEFHDALQSGRPTVVDFGSNRCIPCIRLRPVLRAVKDAHGERVNVIFMEVNDHKSLAQQYRVQLIPTLIFFDGQGREVGRKMGYMDREAMEKVLHDLGFLGG